MFYKIIISQYVTNEMTYAILQPNLHSLSITKFKQSGNNNCQIVFASFTLTI